MTFQTPGLRNSVTQPDGLRANLTEIRDYLTTVTGVFNGRVSSSITLPSTQITGLGTIATQAASAVTITGGTITGITDLAVADGGTGSSTAADARAALGVPAVTVSETEPSSPVAGDFWHIPSTRVTYIWSDDDKWYTLAGVAKI